jgi:hypothetical protein
MMMIMSSSSVFFPLVATCVKIEIKFLLNSNDDTSNNGNSKFKTAVRGL